MLLKYKNVMRIRRKNEENKSRFEKERLKSAYLNM